MDDYAQMGYEDAFTYGLEWNGRVLECIFPGASNAFVVAQALMIVYPGVAWSVQDHEGLLILAAAAAQRARARRQQEPATMHEAIRVPLAFDAHGRALQLCLFHKG